MTKKTDDSKNLEEEKNSSQEAWKKAIEKAFDEKEKNSFKKEAESIAAEFKCGKDIVEVIDIGRGYETQSYQIEFPDEDDVRYMDEYGQVVYAPATSPMPALHRDFRLTLFPRPEPKEIKEYFPIDCTYKKHEDLAGHYIISVNMYAKGEQREILEPEVPEEKVKQRCLEIIISNLMKAGRGKKRKMAERD